MYCAPYKMYLSPGTRTEPKGNATEPMKTPPQKSVILSALRWKDEIQRFSYKNSVKCTENLYWLSITQTKICSKFSDKIFNGHSVYDDGSVYTHRPRVLSKVRISEIFCVAWFLQPLYKNKSSVFDTHF